MGHGPVLGVGIPILLWQCSELSFLITLRPGWHCPSSCGGIVSLCVAVPTCLSPHSNRELNKD